MHVISSHPTYLCHDHCYYQLQIEETEAQRGEIAFQVHTARE